MNTLKIGIVGSRFAGMLHAESYKRCPDVEIHAVAAIDNLDQFAATYTIPNKYDDYHEMFARENLDLVSVCVPNFLHRDIVVAAAQAGIGGIICEKPFATSLEDGREMLDICRQKRVNLMYAEDWIFAPALVRAREICNEGGIGDILYVKAKETHNGSHSMYAQKKEFCGGGSMIHLGIHPVGFLPWLLDQEISKVVAMKTAGEGQNLLHKNYGGEDWAAALIEMEGGTRAMVEGNYITCGGMDDKVEIYGSEGNIHVDLTMGSPLTVYSRKGFAYAVEKADFTHGWTRPAVDEFLSLGYVGEIAHFVNCVKSGKLSQTGTRGIDGYKALLTVLAVYQSAEKGCHVKLSDFSPAM